LTAKVPVTSEIHNKTDIAKLKTTLILIWNDPAIIIQQCPLLPECHDSEVIFWSRKFDEGSTGTQRGNIWFGSNILLGESLFQSKTVLEKKEYLQEST